jgi:hypothetical protein
LTGLFKFDAHAHIRRHPPFYKGRGRRSMIRKSGNRFSENIMFKQRDEIMTRLNLIES